MVDKSNPWSDEGWNVTAQGEYVRQHGEARAQARAKDAGTTLGGRRPGGRSVSEGPRRDQPRYKPGSRPAGRESSGTPVNTDDEEREKRYIILKKRIFERSEVFIAPMPAAESPLGIEMIALLDTSLQSAQALGVEMAVEIETPVAGDVKATENLGIEMNAQLNREVSVSAPKNLGVEMDVLLQPVMPSTEHALGVEMDALFDFEASMSSTQDLGVQMAVTLAQERDLVAAPELGVQMSAILDASNVLIMDANPSLGIEMAALLSPERNVSASSHELGVQMAALLEAHKLIPSTAAEIGIQMAATVVAVTGVTPGSQTFNSGSGNFVVPAFNILTIEVWAGGGGGGSAANGVTNAGNGSDGGSSTVTRDGGTIVCQAIGGKGGVACDDDTDPTASTTGQGGFGGSVDGSANSTDSQNGTAGTAAATWGGPSYQSCSGGTAGGTGGGTGGSSSQPGANLTSTVGGSGTAPGGGGATGTRRGVGQYLQGDSGGGGQYKKAVYNVGNSVMTAGETLAYVVGAGGNGGSVAQGGNGGAGAVGRVKFTWS